ncbi:MAG: TonB-dependent receptor, partial [Chitinophagaceae bacterium]
YKQYDFIQKLFFTSGKKLEHTLNFQYSNTGNVYRYDRLTETSNGSLKSAEWYYGPARRLLFSYRLEILKANFYDNASITSAFQDIDESRHNRNFGSSRLNHRYENVKVYSLNADFSKKIGKNQLRYGSEFTHNNVQSRALQENISTHTFTSLDTRYPSGGSNTQSYAIYATHTAHLTDKFVLNDGLRVTHSRLNADFNDKTFFPFPFNDVNQHSTAFTGNLGLIYNPTTNWKISAVLSSGFRAPNVDDLAKVFESANGNLIIPNPNLKPERTLNYELGVTTVISGKVQLGITGYYTRFTNALTTEPSTFNGQNHVLYNGVLSPVSTTVNKTTAYIYGSNASLAADINKNISFTTSYNYTFGRIKESPEYPLDHIPPSFGRTSISFRFSSFTGELFALYNGAKHAKDYNLRGEDNQVYSADPKDGFTPAWITLNLRTQYQFNKHLSLQFGLENITDRFYRVFASGLSSPGRNFIFTLRGRI